MKIPQSVRIAYEQQLEQYQRLKATVDELLFALARKESRWHYEGRIKSEESYALKLESGRFEADRVEDFFACTLVVENQPRIADAEALIRKLFDLAYRRPPTDRFTHKDSNAFPFDDLRLYVRYKDEPTIKPSGLAGLLFEVQIKTFLQHAWGIATHDFTYKSDDVSWAKERLAYQIKAMLEHAEVSIGNAETLAGASDLAKNNKAAEKLSAALKILKQLWPAEQLPNDLVGLAKNTIVFCDELGVSLQQMKDMVERETVEGRGVLTLNLSPYCILVQTAIYQSPQSFKDFLGREGRKFRLLLPHEIEIPADLEKLLTGRVIRIP